jgi:hypothetical protein
MHQKELARQGQLAAQREKKGLLAAIERAAYQASHLVDRLSHDAVASTRHILDDQFDEVAAARFRDAISQSAEPGERLLGDFHCRVLSIGGPLAPTYYDGWLQVSTHHVIFVCSNRLNFIIPLSDIISIGKAVVHKTSHGALFIGPLPDPYIVPSALRLYTRQGAVHTFFGFHSMRFSDEDLIRDAHAVLDFAWRTRAQVPDSSATFLPEDQPAPPTILPHYAHVLGGPPPSHPPSAASSRPPSPSLSRAPSLSGSSAAPFLRETAAAASPAGAGAVAMAVGGN